jgi:hypothetical protein
MFFLSIVNTKLPPLAWVLSVDYLSDRIKLLHGKSVVVSPDGFVEGAWSGNFNINSFRTAEYVIGSGGWVDGGKLKLRTSTHTLERLWLLKSKKVIYVSNSLPFLLAESNAGLDLSYPYYEADFLSFTLGPKGIKQNIPLVGGAKLNNYIDGLLTINKFLEIGFFVNSEAREFRSYDEYRDHLSAYSHDIVTNALTIGRPKTYQALATISRGYDSPACSVLAHECGADRGITFSEAREGYVDIVDDGEEIGLQLGLKVMKFDRKAYRQGDGNAELCFLASGGGAEDIVFAAAESMLSGTILFTGFLGDTLWGLHSNHLRSLAGCIAFPGGGSIGEFRLQCDFLHLPIPILNLRSHSSIKAISHSAEMMPWRLGSKYDRPIPRRIAESAGISRESFGSNKMAVTIPMYYDDQPLNQMLGDYALKDFNDYIDMRMRKNLFSFSNRFASLINRSLYWFRQRITWRLSKYSIFNDVNDWIRPNYSDHGRRTLSISLLMITWAVERLAEKYRLLLLPNKS